MSWKNLNRYESSLGSGRNFFFNRHLNLLFFAAENNNNKIAYSVPSSLFDSDATLFFFGFFLDFLWVTLK